MKVAFTGHRPQRLGGFKIPNPQYEKIYKQLVESLQKLSPTEAITGMALGVDQWAVDACLELNIPYTAAVPFKGQEMMWPKESQQKYKEYLERAKEVVIVSPGAFSAKKMHLRNEWMVDRCDVLIAVWDGSSTGGTANCVGYAKQKGKKIIEIKP
jgi:uncharacterized phage-like protein YoqJ